MVLEGKDLTTTYGPVTALNGVNISVPAGKVTAVLGPGTGPLPGRSAVEVEDTAFPDLLWSALAIGVVGALGLVVVRRLVGSAGRG